MKWFLLEWIILQHYWLWLYLHTYKAKVLLLIINTCGAPHHASQAEPNTVQTLKILVSCCTEIKPRSWFTFGSKTVFLCSCFFVLFHNQFIINTKNFYCCTGGTNVWQANICQLVAVFHPVIALDRSCSRRRRCWSVQQWNKANSFGCLIIAIANQGWHTVGSETGVDNLPLSCSLAGFPLSLSLSAWNSWNVKLLARFSGPFWRLANTKDGSETPIES